MKKQMLIIPFILLALIFSGCGKGEETVSLKSRRVMTISAMPSPPKSKTTADENEIESVLSLIRSADKKELSPENIKGWQIYIKVESEGKTDAYTIRGDTLKINQKQYSIDGDALRTDIMKIFEKIKEQ